MRQQGKQLFQDKGCTACHTIGKGPLVGPDLKGVTTKRPHEWLEQWIAAPDAMLAKKDPYAVSLLHEYHDVEMPNLGLSKPDVDAILAYLETTASGAAAQPSGAAAEAKSAPAVEGNPEIGKELCSPAWCAFRTAGRRAWPVIAPAASGPSAAGSLGPT